jgi:signal peptidase II
MRALVVVLLVILDLWSKAGVFAALESATDLVRDAHGHSRMHILGEGVGWLTFMRSENAGAAFGRFASMPYLLVGGRILAVTFLSVLLWRSPARQLWLSWALVLVLAGALGNLYDNLTRGAFNSGLQKSLEFGRVRDFIDVYFGAWDWHFPTFNVADSCISVGAVILLLSSFKEDPEQGTGAHAEKNGGADAEENGGAE